MKNCELIKLRTKMVCENMLVIVSVKLTRFGGSASEKRGEEKPGVVPWTFCPSPYLLLNIGSVSCVRTYPNRGRVLI